MRSPHHPPARPYAPTCLPEPFTLLRVVCANDKQDRVTACTAQGVGGAACRAGGVCQRPVTGCAKLAPSQNFLLGNPMYSKTSIALALLACTLPAHADGTAAAQYKTGTLTVDVSGPDVSMQLRLPMTRSSTSSESKENLTPTEVVARLKEATKLFVFPDTAKCQ